jgi:hypothetical protein
MDRRVERTRTSIKWSRSIDRGNASGTAAPTLGVICPACHRRHCAGHNDWRVWFLGPAI